MEIIKTVLEIANMNAVGTFKPPLTSTEMPVISLFRLEERFNYRLATIFFISVVNDDSSFEFNFEIGVITDFLSAYAPIRSNDLYTLYSKANLAVKKHVIEKLHQIGITEAVHWPMFPTMIIEKKLDDAITDMITKEINKNPN